MLALDLYQYQYLINLGLDKQLIQLRGVFVLDNLDPAVEGDSILRARVERFVKRKNFDGLDQMLQDLIHRFRVKYDSEFALTLLQTTGIRIEPTSPEHISVSKIRNLRIRMSGKGNTGLTFVSIELPTGSGSIYCIKGNHPNLSAHWLDAHTVEVKIPNVREEIERVTTVRMYNETLNILYNVKD